MSPRAKKQVAHIRTSSTLTGVHYWMDWLRCPRMAWLGELAKESAPIGQMSHVDYFRVGSILHGLMALHRSLPPDEAMALSTDNISYKTDAGPLDPDEFHEDIAAAEQLYRNYKAYWGPLAVVGKVLAVEKDLQVLLGGNPNLDPGAVILTGGLDLVLKLSKRDVERMGTPGLEEPGVVIVDYKTAAGPSPEDFELYLHDAQLATYPRLWEANGGDRVIGFLVEKLYKAGAKKCERLFIPRRALDTEWVSTEGALKLAVLERDKARYQIAHGGLPDANTTQCFRRTRVGWEFCTHYKSGQCDRKQNHGDGRRKLEVVS